MSKRIAVAIVHGSGTKEPDFAEDIVDMLQACFPKHLPEGARDEAELVIEPVYWADIPRAKEDEVWERVMSAAGSMDHLEIRRFIFNLAGDTLAYQPYEGRKELYLGVHKVMAKAFERLAQQAGPEAPLCVVAHSMGTVVAHNYLYDMQNDTDEASELPRPERPLERGDTLALFITCGSPLAIWRLRFGDEYKPIRFPGAAVEALYPNLEPKWLNIYDADDVLGYPIGTLTDRYEEMVEAGYLEDREKNVGSLLKSWNPMAHKGYFRDESSLDDLAGFLADVWQGAFDA